ncbi:MAG TPA: 50S ribosomal protein L35 [Phycisphaerae bacterium]|nr:50S ribosomal protein L35 [Phycisphaerae bacterium]HOJ75317.1 50S ribosomal protein L35 [Phycisphaerae bacterium]HOM53018.1 50S ribosomal protein L35 [Phycisphaerae bacterium]HON68852.1 50S ribosomal protein L35 [Phycisphaerae bacterium]HOQ87199.1 50S ribosomal protein L35 [Phycisphaerae bacterium]
MPKQKTHKGVAKRVRVTAKGKVKRSRKAFTGHLMSGRNAKRRRRLRAGGVLPKAEAKAIKAALGM